MTTRTTSWRTGEKRRAAELVGAGVLGGSHPCAGRLLRSFSSLDSHDVSIFDQHTARLDVIEFLGRNDGDVSNPGLVRHWARGRMSNGRDWEKRRKYDGEYFHPTDPTDGHVLLIMRCRRPCC